MWSGFGEEGGTPPPRILCRTPQAVILVYGVVNVTKRLARLDAHTYVYQGRRFHALQFLNCCILNESFKCFFFRVLKDYQLE